MIASHMQKVTQKLDWKCLCFLSFQDVEIVICHEN